MTLNDLQQNIQKSTNMCDFCKTFFHFVLKKWRHLVLDQKIPNWEYLNIIFKIQQHLLCEHQKWQSNKKNIANFSKMKKLASSKRVAILDFGKVENLCFLPCYWKFVCKKLCRTEKRFSQYGQLCIKLHMATWRPFLIKIGTIFLNFLEISKKLILCVNLRYFGQLSGELFWVWNVFPILSRKLLLLLLLLLLYNNVRPFLKITYYFFASQNEWVGSHFHS